ncbi:MAG TPA: HAMP domain-containing sensor histidine kinase [Candidatus Limnocylindrales bacterium]
MRFPLRFVRPVRSGARPGSQPGPSVQTLSIRVALIATAIVGATYIFLSVAATAVVVTGLTSDVDRHLNQSLQQATAFGQSSVGPDVGLGQPGFDPTHQDPRGLQIVVWRVGADGTTSGESPNAPVLPPADSGVTGPTTVSISGVDYRISGVNVGTTRMIVGQSLDGVSQTTSTLILAEVGIGVALLVFVFLGSVAVGRRVALPIEQARQRQLEFTADASHELRTPLSVIEAHSSLALARERDPNWDGAAFGRIDTELKRTRRLVDDMLWLARFDSTGGLPQAEPVDVSVLAAQTADRFAAVAETRGQRLEVLAGSHGADAIVTAAPEWLDRLVGILLDNACKYSPDGGTVTVDVAAEGRRVRLTVADSGPGIPETERGRVFDRFHRATDQAGGSGLGLAIADAIVRSTGGRWQIGMSPAGGASISVAWPRYMSPS